MQLPRTFMLRLSAFGLASLITASLGWAADEPKPGVYDDPLKVDADFAFQGEYQGDIPTPDGEKTVGAQVVARGDGQFELTAYVGGLPGDGWSKGGEKHSAKGALKDGVVTFTGKYGTGEIKDGVLKILDAGGGEIGELKKVDRKSPTLGQRPPEGAKVLFDGTSVDAFQGGRITAGGLLMEGTQTKTLFGDYTLHIEFRTPYQPKASGQGRGNSGCYMQGRYEVQVLDSFGLEGKNNECGGLYSIRDPDVNMCFPPLSWQTYDIDFTAARYENGAKVKNAVITVRHNGVVVHQDVELPKTTTAAPVKETPEPGPLYLQNHGNPIRFRNIWLVESK